MAPQVGLEPTTLRLTANRLQSPRTAKTTLDDFVDSVPLCAHPHWGIVREHRASDVGGNVNDARSPAVLSGQLRYEGRTLLFLSSAQKRPRAAATWSRRGQS